MPKILFFDVDGTLSTYNEKKGFYVPESAIDAIRKTREKGNLCFLSTGRSLPEITADLVKIGFDGIISAAGNCISYHDEIIFHTFLSETDAREITTDLIKYDTCFALERNEGIYINPKQIRKEEEDQRFSFNDFVSVVDKEMHFEDVNKICFFGDKASFTALKEKYGKRYSFYVSSYGNNNEYAAEVSLKGISKGSAITYLLNNLKLSKDDAYGFGDSDNDIEMFKACGTAITLKEHRASVEPYVDYIGTGIEEDGIEKAMQHFDLI